LTKPVEYGIIYIMQFDDTNWIQNWTGGQCPAPPP